MWVFKYKYCSVCQTNFSSSFKPLLYSEFHEYSLITVLLLGSIAPPLGLLITQYQLFKNSVQIKCVIKKGVHSSPGYTSRNPCTLRTTGFDKSYLPQRSIVACLHLNILRTFCHPANDYCIHTECHSAVISTSVPYSRSSKFKPWSSG